MHSLMWMRNKCLIMSNNITRKVDVGKLGFFQSHKLRSGNNSIVFNFIFSIVHATNFLLHCRRNKLFLSTAPIFHRNSACPQFGKNLLPMSWDNFLQNKFYGYYNYLPPIKYSVPSIFSLSASGFHSVNFFMDSGRALAKTSILTSGFWKISRALNKKKQAVK